MTITNPRRSGKNGQILGQMSTTAVTGEALTHNTVPEVIDGVTYPAYSVFTATNALWLDNPAVVLTETIASPVASQTRQIRYELGKVIYTPALGSGDTVNAAYSYAVLMTVGNMYNWKMDVKLENVDVTAFLDGWHNRVATYRDWSGSADEYQTNDYWYAACTANNFFYVKLYPDIAVNQYWVGRAIIDWGVTTPHTGAVTGAIKFTGTGSLSYYSA